MQVDWIQWDCSIRVNKIFRRKKKMQVKAYLEITMKIDNDKRPFNQRGRCASSSRI